MLPLRRSKFLGIRKADPAVSLICISLQQAPAVLLINNGVHTHRDIAVGGIGSGRALPVIEVGDGNLHQVRREGALNSRIYLTAVIIKGSIAWIGVNTEIGRAHV